MAPHTWYGPNFLKELLIYFGLLNIRLDYSIGNVC